jgi:hypothetical protein
MRVIAILLGFYLFSACSAVFVIIEEGRQKCLLEDVPKDTLVLSRYRTEEISGAGVPKEAEMKVSVLDPDGNYLLEKEYNTEGRVAFTSQKGGEHKICFQLVVQRGSWFGSRQKVVWHDVVIDN